MTGDQPAMGAEERRQAALDAATARVDTTTARVGINPDEAHITDRGRYCPAPVPCLGRTAVGVAVPVRLQSTLAQAGEVFATYCPQCRAWAADRRNTMEVPDGS